MAGFGRAGDWFALDAYKVRPDLITFAKGVNAGYVPVGGVIISEEISATFDERVFPGGLTYSGHPLAAASIVASIDAFEEDNIVKNADATRYLKEWLVAHRRLAAVTKGGPLSSQPRNKARRSLSIRENWNAR